MNKKNSPALDDKLSAICELHGGETIEAGTLHGGEDIQPGILHGGEDLDPWVLH